MRCFIGFFVPDPAKGVVLGIQDALRKAPISSKMVEPENLHVNLSFLGEVPDDDLSRIESQLEAICKRTEGFEVRIGALRPIPDESRMRVIVLEASDNGGTMLALSSDISKSLGGDSKPPHITLARVKEVHDARAVSDFFRTINHGMSVESFLIGKIELIRSELGHDGPKYTITRSFNLGVGSPSGRT